ncbi:MAG: GNAT family N-acetyltransferase [Syntrophaceae bacterium]|nr:GNAT family N-acetyltransferase [Syntrophaceae bacterium]
MLKSSVLNKSMELPGIKLRKLSGKDIPQIIDIHGAITKKKAHRRWVQQMVKDHLRKQEGVGFVAEIEGQVVGFIIGEMKGEGFGLEKSGWLEVVMVHPHYMGKGIGRSMARKLFDCFKRRGIRDVYTSVLWDAVDMLSFFKSLGFDRSTFINLIKHVD